MVITTKRDKQSLSEIGKGGNKFTPKQNVCAYKNGSVVSHKFNRTLKFLNACKHKYDGLLLRIEVMTIFSSSQ